MGIIDGLVNIVNSLNSWFEQFFFQITKFFNGVLSVLSYIWSMLESMWYGLTTILSGMMDLIQDLFTTGLF